MNSEQLDLFEGEVARLPWRGRSPRDLTRVGLGLFLRREPQKDDRFFVDPNQVEMFPVAMRKPPEYQGAPLLRPLPGGNHGKI